ncbi:sugar phosphate isomerase/epimerase family protein [Paenibacillus sacheonensis]|uniref:sugar phosphate isomerase/epimerase family protein n=1 Tax=Paenibacillus sacheonensis TaxID=742054 RepID=UPI00147830B2|nr:sugar phosphate isomerase/epimerase [Paenibacillus sacheonensis]MBM7567686.1 sugar phosphate isomerase/epimerase [Paenibacillus sacheonensis]
MIKQRLAAQLYTVRNELKKDFEAVLRELAQMGWAAVQIDGLHGNPARDIAAVMNELGLKTAGMHVGLPRMRDDLDNVLEEARLFGTKDFICHSLPDGLQNPEGYASVKRDLLAVAERVKGTEFRVGYHNHDFEFHTTIDGKFALEYLLDDPAIYAEIDTYWVKKAGQDPLSFIRGYANRMPILHLKDMTADDRQYFAEIGSGVIDFAPILRWGLASGVEWFAVEQDYCPGSPLDSLAASLEYLLKLDETL